MSRKFWKPLLAVPSLLGATIAVSAIAATSVAANAAETATVSVSSVEAAEPVVEASAAPVETTTIADATIANAAPAPTQSATTASAQENEATADLAATGIAGQVTSVSQLSDVQPTDWAFQALQSLVERYGCIVGYPDRTYRGNRALTRYEFAAGLNACMDRINELIAAGTADLVKKEDLLAVQKLQEEFAAELATLRGRVDAVEARTATLEKQQFSTTTKLVGEAIFTIADTFGDSATRTGNGTLIPGTTENDNTETIFADRVRLNLDSSFTGKDQLRIRLQARNITPFSGAAFTGTNETRLGFDGNNSNSLEVSKVFYRFALSNNFRLQVDAVGNEFYNGLVSTLSPFTSSGNGALSRFGRFSPIYRSNANGAGFTFEYKFSDFLALQGGYIADTLSNDPTPTNGLFNGAYTALGQVVLKPSRALEVALTYARSYYPGNEVNITSSTGSGYASNPFASSAAIRRATSSDAFGVQAQFRLSPKFIVGGWFGYTKAYQAGNANEADVLNGSVFLAFPDLGKKGNLGGIIVGIPPKVTGNDFIAANGLRRIDDDTTYHVEALYRYRVTNNIAITPGVIVIFNPEGNNDNATQYVGVIRTTFSF
ncbi:iron uptake porin [Leptolyngbya sp. FACHB-321]|nr:iron uptake porin [Leptolyngbya sp. FACHB-321]MBD2038757.1 iron uptake porin [Leptolyngbya sp. FACHB-321]